MKFPSIIAADNFIWCLVSVQIVDIFYPIMSFQIVLREAAQVGYMQSNDWYTISPSVTLHVTLPLPVPSPLTLRARAPAPAR